MYTRIFGKILGLPSSSSSALDVMYVRYNILGDANGFRTVIDSG